MVVWGILAVIGMFAQGLPNPILNLLELALLPIGMVILRAKNQ